MWRRVEVVNANNFHWSLLHMNEEPDLSLTCLWSHYGHFGYPCHIFLLLRVLLMRWDGFKYFCLACRSQIRQRVSLSENRKGLLWLAIREPLMNRGACHNSQTYNRENHIQKSEISEDLAALRCGHWCASVVKCFGLFLRNAHYHNDIESGTSGNRSRRGKHYKRYFFSQLHGGSCWKDIYGRVLLKGSILGKTYLWCCTNCGF